MWRQAFEKLEKWKTHPRRKPLIISGARQVGKTWLAREFGRIAYRNCIYLNFDNDETCIDILKGKDGIRSAGQIMARLHQRFGDFTPEETLLVFEEMQMVPNALSRLKYLCEDYPQYHVICCGSLMGFSAGNRLGQSGAPVGMTQSLTLYPFTFLEFLYGTGRDNLADVVDQGDWNAMKVLKKDFERALREYFLVGGMPAVVDDFAVDGDFYAVRAMQSELLTRYEWDFVKFGKDNANRAALLDVWHGLASQVGVPDAFFAKSKKPLSRATFEARSLAINWLHDAGLIIRLPHVSQWSQSVLFDVRRWCKTYLFDTGLCSCIRRVDPLVFMGNEHAYEGQRGPLTEQFVIQHMNAMYGEGRIGFWDGKIKGSDCEVDCLAQTEYGIVPIEVKAGTNTHSTSLNTLRRKYEPLRALRFSLKEPGIDNGIWAMPLYAITSMDKFIRMDELKSKKRKKEETAPLMAM